MATVKIGTELTFLPTYTDPIGEWASEKAAHKVAGQMVELYNEERGKDKTAKRFVGLTFKADPFRVDHFNGPQKITAWCIEVNSDPFSAAELADKHSPEYLTFKLLYSVARRLKLSPCIVRRKRDGTIMEYPTGGGHIHVASNLFQDGPYYHLRIHALERALCLDYTNHPFIRWMFAQWSDDENSHLPNRRTARWFPNDGPIQRAHEAALMCSSISQRMAHYSALKAHYPTWELRFFDMPKTVAELELQARFVKAWVGYHVAKICELDLREKVILSYKVPLTWKAGYQARLFKSVPFARAEIKAFWTKIGLDIADYEGFWVDHYHTRMTSGKPE